MNANYKYNRIHDANTTLIIKNKIKILIESSCGKGRKYDYIRSSLSIIRNIFLLCWSPFGTNFVLIIETFSIYVYYFFFFLFFINTRPFYTFYKNSYYYTIYKRRELHVTSCNTLNTILYNILNLINPYKIEKWLQNRLNIKI